MAGVKSEAWLQEKLVFIRSVVTSVDDDSLKSQLMKCETEDEVEAVLQSLLLLNEASTSSDNQMPKLDAPRPKERTANELEADFSDVDERQTVSDSTDDTSGSWVMVDDIDISESNSGFEDHTLPDGRKNEDFQMNQESPKVVELMESNSSDDLADLDELEEMEVLGVNTKPSERAAAEAVMNEDTQLVSIEDDDEIKFLGVYNNRQERVDAEALTEEREPLAVKGVMKEESFTEEVSQIDQAVANGNYEKDMIIALRIEVISNIFPDADPDFFQEKIDACMTLGDDEKSFSLFVESLLKINNYPTMKDYIKRMEALVNEKSEKSDKDYEEEGYQVPSPFFIKCSICLEDIISTEMGFCNSMENEHIYCLQCIKKYTKAELEQGRSTFKCMDSDCSAEFSFKILRKVMDKSDLARAYEQRQYEEVSAAKIENLESCPFCNYKAIVTNQEDKVFMCMNPKCMKDSCRSCKEENHIPLRCNEVEKDVEKEARKTLENKMSEAMIRECPQCKKRFIKQAGCNQVKCSCGAGICYYCRHLLNSSHHMSSRICQQNSNEDLIHQEEVRRAAYEGKQEMNPNIKLIHDPTKGVL
ncbi:uncharacterized protein [Palaemon carinicauda]|uniref:uncharacterized protein isoform X1 n=1 Tax=Palaemon carinicauda TaxID=392227 RepID=UPI0035B6565D